MSIGDIALIAVLVGLIPAFIARSRGQPFLFFWFIGTIFFPLGLVLALLVKNAKRKCPFCAEVIQPAATVCPHCQRDLTPITA